MSACCVAVAYSAGRDSTALLHATLQAAAEQGLEVAALHVHHGLSPHADAWLSLARRQCEVWADAGWRVRLHSISLKDKPPPGDSVEAWARAARYRVLRQLAVEAGASLVLLAHHRRDQAETLLLQALRGGGVAGLAGMPRVIERDGITWARPWLDQPREAIEAYIRRHGLQYVDDDSNSDPRFARNRLRLQVWPVLQAAFPQAETTLADAASWSRDASACLDGIASADLERASVPGGLVVAAWQSLPPARQVNALRTWLKRELGRPAPASLVQRLREELPAASPSARWPVNGGELRCYRGVLRLGIEAPSPAAPSETALSIRRAGRYRLPGWGGELIARRVKEGGVPVAWLTHLELRGRSGGEQFQPVLGRPARSLKKQYQAAGVPAWDREGPLVFSGGQLVFVPGLGIDVRVLALPGQPQLSLQWQCLRAG